MGEWGFLSGLFDNLQAHSPMLGRFWLFLLLVFRIVILGTVASDMFEDEQQEFFCNTLQPGCKQVCYDEAFPISQYRFWVFHIVVIATPSMLFLMYATHHQNKKNTLKPKLKRNIVQGYREDQRLRCLYIVNVIFRITVEVAFLVGQWLLYGFKVGALYSCTRFPCIHTVDCFTSRPSEKTVFLYFYFVVGVVSAVSSCVELFHSYVKWFCCNNEVFDLESYTSQNSQNLQQDDSDSMLEGKTMSQSAGSSVRLKKATMTNSKKILNTKAKKIKQATTKTLVV